MRSIPVAPGVVTEVGNLQVCHAAPTTVCALVDEQTGITHLPPVAIWSVRPIVDSGDDAMNETAARSHRAALMNL